MSQFIRQKNQKGFTLIEMLVYMAVFVLVASALVGTFLSLDTILVRNQTERVLTQEARVALEHILFNARRADDVIDATGNTLEIDGPFGTTRYYVSGGVLMVEEESGVVTPLTSDAVTINDLEFTWYTGTYTELIRVDMTLYADSKAASSTRTYSASTVLRGSYE